jgi:hypothetical protein
MKNVCFKKNSSGIVESIDYQENPEKKDLEMQISNKENENNQLTNNSHFNNDKKNLETIFELDSALEKQNQPKPNAEQTKITNIERNSGIIDFYLACIEIMCAILIELVALQREAKLLSKKNLEEVISNSFKVFVIHIEKMSKIFQHVNIFALNGWDDYLGSSIFTKQFEIFIQYLQFDGKNLDGRAFDQQELLKNLKFLIFEVNHLVGKKGKEDLIPLLQRLIIFYEKIDFFLFSQIYLPDLHSVLPMTEKPDYKQLRTKIYNYN